MALEFTDANFQAEVKDSGKLTVVDFWAVWCGPCKMVSPIIDELASEYGEQVNIGKMDVDTNPAISGEFGVRSIPTVLYIKNGEVVDKIVGATTKAVYEAKMKEHMA
jgi:thioredoxin 1